MMGRAYERFTLFLGPARLRALFLLIASTGLLSLILNVIVNDFEWVRPTQTILVLVMLIGATIIIGGRMDSEDRARWIAILAPAVGLIVLGIVVIPQFSLVLFGGALGWIVAGTILFRPRTPTSYQKAVKALKKGHLEVAVQEMDQVIKDDPDDPNYYRFRAELLRLWGKLERARRDYVKMTELETDSAVGYNGLAEVDLQAGNYQRALDSANKAAELAPDEWVALYNLGMIEDRLGKSQEVIGHLDKALALKVPDARHRLLIHLYLLRAYARLGNAEAARSQFDLLKKQRGGLEEWQKILENEQAEVLRAVLGDDVKTARDLVDAAISIEEVGAH
ncbi:MAG: tetratricopeptide repeat protein [Anaerolineae bacterium]|nr:tetratricopeptide repeat protein [Anaerolineae bacterium]